MFKIACTKHRNLPAYHMLVIPMQDESTCNRFDSQANGAATWAYVNDMKKHGRIPAVVLPGCMSIWGGEERIRAAGYRKHWIVFENPLKEKYTFGNQLSFSIGDAASRAIAEKMLEISLSDLS